MSDETTAGTPGPDSGSEAVPEFTAAEDAARDEALAQTREAATGGAHDAHDAHDAHGGHGGPALGPIDWRAYGAGIVGAALGLAVAAVLAVTTGYVVL